VKTIKIYPNECVKRIIAFIPPKHIHARFIIELEDQVIVLHEAAVANLVRAYIDIVTHPTRRAVELVHRAIPKSERKPMYAEHQLVELEDSEENIVSRAMEILEKGVVVCAESSRSSSSS